MIAFLAIFAAGLCGYAQAPVLAWPLAATALASVSWAQRYLLIRRGVEAGLDDLVLDTLIRSLFNSLVATGGCYWFGVALRG
jgi:hypothetical protein